MVRPKGATLRVIVGLALVFSPACLVRRHKVTSPTARQQLIPLNATEDQLIAGLHRISDPIHDFIMTADLSPSVLNPSKGVVTDYATVTAYVLFQRPADIRLLAKDPVIGTTIFDMVSDGATFRASIPPKKRFIIGSNNAPVKPGNKLEDLRPAALLTSLVICPPNPEADLTLLEKDSERAAYILMIIGRRENGFVLARQVYFDGRTLQVTRQKTFDASGDVVGDTTYAGWVAYNGVPYPSQIDIRRLKDNYEVQLSVLTMKINTPDVTAQKFVLTQPPDTKVEELK